MLIGKKAPAFSTKAFVQGKIVNVSLDDLKGRWTVLFFYSGDFTYV